MKTIRSTDGIRYRAARDKAAVSGQGNIFQRILIAVAFVLPAAFATAAPDQRDRVRVLLRYDDYTRDSSAVVERRLLAGLERLGAPVLVGVVPFADMPYPELSAALPSLQANLGPEKLALLQELRARSNAEIALHGFSHRTNFMINRQPSEFAGLGLDRQRQLLVLGRAALEQAFGSSIRVFIPPYNTFDSTTLRAMEQTGFTVLSAGGTPPNGGLSLTYVPGTVYPQQMRRAIEAALQRDSGARLIVVVMHPYDFVESDASMPAFREHRGQIGVNALLDDIRWAKSQPSVKFVSLSSELAERCDLSATRVVFNAQLRSSVVRSHALLPGALASPPLDGALLSAKEARELFWKESVFALVLFAGISTAAYACSRWLNGMTAIGRMRGLQRRLLAVMLPTLVIVSLVQGLYFLKAVLLVSGLGWYAGTRARP